MDQLLYSTSLNLTFLESHSSIGVGRFRINGGGGGGGLEGWARFRILVGEQIPSRHMTS